MLLNGLRVNIDQTVCILVSRYLLTYANDRAARRVHANIKFMCSWRARITPTEVLLQPTVFRTVRCLPRQLIERPNYAFCLNDCQNI